MNYQTSDYVPYIFVIDTEQYSGNFEREMTTYITGLCDDYDPSEMDQFVSEGVFSEEQAQWFADSIEYVRDDEHDSYHPCGIWITPGWVNDGHGNCWPVGTPEEIIREKYEETVREYYVSRLNELNEALKRNPGNWATYNSVAIFFNDKPPENYIKLMKDRANEYAQNNKITITGFRLLKQEMTLKQTYEDV